LATGDAQYRDPFGPTSPDFIQVPFGDLPALAQMMNEQVAAVIFETIPATLGIAIPPDDFFAGVRQLCDQYGAVMIADEVQTGLGRCGEIWGINLHGVVPDIIVSGKGLSGGLYPISATIYREHLNPFMHENPFIHISTCGGAELGCAVALTVLDTLTEPEFLPHVRQMAALFAEGFANLQSKHATILTEVRQKGLMMGLKLAHPMMGPMMTVVGMEAGLLIIYANNDTSVVQVLPPLIIEADQVAEVLQRLDGALTAVTAVAP
jgi:acetylornithine/succinyldiaminopimelate/putrescine aminotransferase